MVVVDDRRGKAERADGRIDGEGKKVKVQRGRKRPVAPGPGILLCRVI